MSNCSRLARRAGDLPNQAWLERRGLGSCALPTHRELPFVYNWEVLRTPLFYKVKSLCNCTSAAPEPLVPQSNVPHTGMPKVPLPLLGWTKYLKGLPFHLVASNSGALGLNGKAQRRLWFPSLAVLGRALNSNRTRYWSGRRKIGQGIITMQT